MQMERFWQKALIPGPGSIILKTSGAENRNGAKTRRGESNVKKLFLMMLAWMMLCAAAMAETVNPFAPTQVNADAEAGVLHYENVDFSAGGAILRFKAVSDSQLTIRVYADDPTLAPIATVVFRPITKEYRSTVQLEGVHDLYFELEGSGTFLSWQAFTAQAEIDAAVRAERGTAYEDTVPARYTSKCQQGGAIEPFAYTAHDYYNDEAVYEKNAFVYLPYGYDPESTYDLLILCHGIGGSEYEWGMTNDDSRVKRIMDHLIANGEIRPFIVVTPNGRAGKTQDHSSFYGFDKELRNDLLPALAARYAVDITDRSRCAMAGLSMGGMQTINLGIGKCLDLFSAFGAFSACPTTNPAAITAACLNAEKDLPVRMFYSICGTEDSIALASADAAVKGLETLTDQLNEKNYIVQHVPGGHDFGVWYLGFYNFARMIGE